MNNEEIKYKTVIEAGKVHKTYLRDLWIYRELFLFMAWRDILVRYKQTIIGIAWSVIRPLLAMIIFTIIFGTLAKLPSDGAPYAVMVYCAMLPWQFFSNTLNEGGNSLVNNSNMISKVYFPRIIIPTSSMIVSLVDFIISLVILAIIMGFYMFIPSWKCFFIIPFLLLAIVVSLGVTYLISALNVKYRDFRYVLPFIIQFGLYVSPVGFSSSIIPDKWRLIYSINPMVSVIDGFRWSIIGNNQIIYWPGFLISLAVAIGLFFLGFAVFRKTEREFADVI